MTAASPTGGRSDPLLAELSSGAVDMFDVAARLEASGVSDRTATGVHGRRDVFALAAALHDGTPGPDDDGGRRPEPASGLAEALRRAGLLIAGVLLAAAVLGSVDVGPGLVWVAGVTAWVGGQAVAAISWNRLGWGQADLGLRRGAAASVIVLAVAVAVPLAVPGLTGDRLVGVAVCAGWAAYACAVSLLVCSRRTVAALTSVGVGALGAGSAQLAGGGWSDTAVPVVAVATALAVVLLAVGAVRRAGAPQRPDRADRAAARPALGQAALLALSLVLLLQTVPQGGTSPLVVASVVGAATADPAIALLRARLRSSAARVHAVADAARRAQRAALTAAAGTALVSALASAGVVLAVHAGVPSWPAIVGPAAAYTALATTSAALTAFGAPAKAVLVAALAGGYAVSALLSGVVAVAAVFPLCLVAAVGLLMHRVSDPRVVA